MKTNFKTKYVDGVECVMPVDGLSIKEIRCNQITKEISIITKDDIYTLEDLDALSWQTIKSMVVDNDGEWINKSSGIDFMIGRPRHES